MQTPRAGASVEAAAGVSVAIYRQAVDSADPADPVASEGSGGSDGSAAIADAVAAFSGTSAIDVVIARHCRRCGADDHGKPRILSPAHTDGSEIQVSLSRAGGQVVVAVTTGSPIGCDVEDPVALAAAIAAAPVDEVLLHPDERRALAALPESLRDHRRTLLWTAKEAVLKATGWGLAIAPATLSLTVLADDELILDAWPAELELDDPPSIVVVDLPATDAGSRLLGAVAVLAPSVD